MSYPNSPAPTAAGWYPDPTGVHQLRLWNGQTWTDNVACDGKWMSPDRASNLDRVNRVARIVLAVYAIIALAFTILTFVKSGYFIPWLLIPLIAAAGLGGAVWLVLRAFIPGLNPWARGTYR